MGYQYSGRAIDFLRAWDSAGRPTPWEGLPQLADIFEEDRIGHSGILVEMRSGREFDRDYTPLSDDDVDVALGLIPSELDDYDWKEVFKYCTEAYNRPARPDSRVSIDSFSRRDVKRVVKTAHGENDGANWVCVGELRDGRFFAVDAGCDYTGWG